MQYLSGGDASDEHKGMAGTIIDKELRRVEERNFTIDLGALLNKSAAGLCTAPSGNPISPAMSPKSRPKRTHRSRTNPDSPSIQTDRSLAWSPRFFPPEDSRPHAPLPPPTPKLAEREMLALSVGIGSDALLAASSLGSTIATLEDVNPRQEFITARRKSTCCVAS